MILVAVNKNLTRKVITFLNLYLFLAKVSASHAHKKTFWYLIGATATLYPGSLLFPLTRTKRQEEERPGYEVVSLFQRFQRTPRHFYSYDSHAESNGKPQRANQV